MTSSLAHHRFVTQTSSLQEQGDPEKPPQTETLTDLGGLLNSIYEDSYTSKPRSLSFPRSIKPNFTLYLDEEEVEKAQTMAAGETRPTMIQIHSNSLDKPELMSSHSMLGSTVNAISPETQSRLAQYPRRGSDIVMGKGMKNRSRSVVIKLQVPSKNSPLMSRKPVCGLESKSSPDVRERAMTYSAGSPSSNKRNKSPTPIIDYGPDEDSDKFDDGFDVSPVPSRLHYVKRNSFLYLSDTDEVNPLYRPATSRSSSISNNLFGTSDEVYITPFAQLLANLQNVRNQFIILADPPISEERRKKLNLPSQFSPGKLSDEEHKALSLNILDELDSCLHRLETVNSAKSMGNMAQDKFRRILSRELSHLSERSKSGHFVAEWVNNLTGSSQADYDEIDRTLDTMSVIQSSQGLGSVLTSKTKTRAISVADEIPRFGITGLNINYDLLQEFFDNNMDEWGFDAFRLNFLSSSQPLVSLGYAIFTLRGLFSEFKISKQRFINFMEAVQGNYWSKNSYHNSIHAADVLHATNYLLRANALDNVFTELEIMASLVAAAVHDVDHPGRNNQFLINTSHELATMYNDESVLENHHLAVTFKLLKDESCNFLENLEPAQMKAFRRMVIDNVLATDMTKHLKHLGDLKTKVETKKLANEGILQLDKFQDRSEVLQCLMHCADLSNPAKPPDIASSWAYRIMEESFLQGDEEKKLSIDIGPLGDRENVCVEKCQVSFIDFVIFPLWETWAELVYPDAQPVLDHLGKTREYWSARVVNSPLPPEDTPPNNEDSKEMTPIDETAILSPIESENLMTLPPAAAAMRRDSYRSTRHVKEIDRSLSQTVERDS